MHYSFHKTHRLQSYFSGFLKATTKMKASVLYFALLPNLASSDELYKMVELILNHANEIGEREKLIGSATIDNQTPLGRALCHSAVTNKLIKELIKDNDQFNMKQLLVAFEMVARHPGQNKEYFDYLKPLLERLRKHNSGDSKSDQLPHIICRYNNALLLKWFYQYSIKVRLNLKDLSVETNVNIHKSMRRTKLK